jgi:hypothetical protein
MTSSAVSVLDLIIYQCNKNLPPSGIVLIDNHDKEGKKTRIVMVRIAKMIITSTSGAYINLVSSRVFESLLQSSFFIISMSYGDIVTQNGDTSHVRINNNDKCE